MESFSLTLLSNSSIDIYDNTLSSFTNLLKSSIQLNGNWVVGLSEIYVNKLNYVERNKRDVQCDYLRAYTDELTKIKSLIDEFLGEDRGDGKPKKKRSDIPNLFEYIDSIFNPIHNLTEKVVEHFNATQQQYSINNDIVEQAFIYTDIMQSRYIGNQLSRCLKIIPLKNNQNYLSFDKIDYFPIQSNILKDISILITNGSGEKINFKTSNLPTFCTLHFKKHI